MAMSGESTILASGAADNTVRLWDMRMLGSAEVGSSEVYVLRGTMMFVQLPNKSCSAAFVQWQGFAGDLPNQIHPCIQLDFLQ